MIEEEEEEEDLLDLILKLELDEEEWRKVWCFIEGGERNKGRRAWIAPIFPESSHHHPLPTEGGFRQLWYSSWDISPPCTGSKLAFVEAPIHPKNLCSSHVQMPLCIKILRPTGTEPLTTLSWNTLVTLLWVMIEMMTVIKQHELHQVPFGMCPSLEIQNWFSDRQHEQWPWESEDSGEIWNQIKKGKE